MNETPQYIVGLGEALWDLLPEGRQLGGAPANFAYHAAQAGCLSCAVSAVGKDALGEEIIRRFQEKKLQHCCPKVDFPTGTVEVALDADGIPSYDIRTDVAWDHIPFTAEMEALAKQCRAVCFGTLAQRSEVSRSTLHNFLQAMPDGKCVYKVFDINLRQHFYDRTTITDSLALCNVLKLNDEEVEVVRRLLGSTAPSAEAFCRGLLEDYKLDFVMLTCGVVGSYVFSPSETSYFPTPEVEVADTVGAGDAFTAAFIASLVKGLPLRAAHRKAVAVSAYVCTQRGAMPEWNTALREDHF